MGKIYSSNPLFKVQCVFVFRKEASEHSNFLNFLSLRDFKHWILVEWPPLSHWGSVPLLQYRSRLLKSMALHRCLSTSRLENAKLKINICKADNKGCITHKVSTLRLENAKLKINICKALFLHWLKRALCFLTVCGEKLELKVLKGLWNRTVQRLWNRTVQRSHCK